jgi:hypothetical protein
MPRMLALKSKGKIMDNSQGEANSADLFLDLFPSHEDAPLPMPRFGKEPPQQAQSLPGVGPRAAGRVDDLFSLSWLDEEELGIRVFIKEEPGAHGIEIRVDAEGVHPELLGKGVSIALVAEKGDRFKRLTVLLDKVTDDKRGCSGNGCFGAAADLRKQLGEKVTLDVFLIE